MKNFRTYQLAMALVRDTKNLTLSGPERDQFKRAVLSVALNLAEGSAKPTKKDQKRFYFISLGSLREVQCLLSLSDDTKLQIQADTLAAHLYKLCHH